MGNVAQMWQILVLKTRKRYAIYIAGFGQVLDVFQIKEDAVKNVYHLTDTAR